MTMDHPNILIVDDDLGVRMLLADLLEMEGYNVRTASDGYAALASVEGREPDCIVLDVMMPGIDGHAVLDHIRGRASVTHVPVVMLTAAANDKQAWQAWSGGADYFLAKPFEPDELVSYLSRLFAALSADTLG